MSSSVWEAFLCVRVYGGRFGGGQGSHKNLSSSGCIVVEITNVSI